MTSPFGYQISLFMDAASVVSGAVQVEKGLSKVSETAKKTNEDLKLRSDTSAAVKPVQELEKELKDATVAAQQAQAALNKLNSGSLFSGQGKTSLTGGASADSGAELRRLRDSMGKESWDFRAVRTIGEASVKAGELRDRLSEAGRSFGNGGGINSGLRSVRAELGVTSQEAMFLRHHLQTLFIVTGLGGILSTMREFEQTLSNIGAVAEASAHDVELFRQKALELGQTTRFNPGQVGRGMEELLKAGFSMQETSDTIQPALLMAQVSGSSPAQSTRLLVETIRAFNVEAKQATVIADMLAKTANKSSADITSLGEGLKYVAPTAAELSISVSEMAEALAAAGGEANAFKLPIADTLAIIGKFSDAGMKGSVAGTGLRRVLAELAAPTTKTKEVLAAYGLTAQDVNPKVVGLSGAIAKLKDAGLSSADAFNIFGKQGQPFYNLLARNSEGVAKLREELEKSDGALKTLADRMDDNINGAFLKFSSNVYTAIVAIGDSGAGGAMSKFFTMMSSGLQFVTRHSETFANAAGYLGTLLAVNLAGRGIKAVAAGLSNMFFLLRSNPLVFFAGLAVKAGAAIFAFKDQISLFGLVVEDVKASYSDLMKLFAGTEDSAGKGKNSVIGFGSTFAGFLTILNGAAAGLKTTITLISQTWDAVATGTKKAWAYLSGGVTASGFSQAQKEAEVLEEEYQKRSLLRDKELAEISEHFDKTQKKYSDAALKFSSEFNKTRDKVTGGFSNSDSVKPAPALEAGLSSALSDDAVGKKVKTFADVVEQLRRTADAAALAGDDLAVFEAKGRAADDMGRQLSAGQSAQIESLVRLSEATKRQTSVLAELRRPETERRERLSALQALLKEGKITLSEHNEEVRKAGEAYDKATNPLKAFYKTMEAENQKLTMSSLDRAVFEKINEAKAAANVGKLGDTDRIRIESMVAKNRELSAEREVLDGLTGAYERYAKTVAATASLEAAGKISPGQKRGVDNKAEGELLGSIMPDGALQGYLLKLSIMRNSTKNAAADIGASFAEAFGPGGTLITGISEAAGRAVVFGDNFRQSVSEISKSILSQLIGSLVKAGATMLINYTLGQSLQAGSVATSTAAGAATAAAWAPAAAAASLATAGTNAVPATAGIGGVFAAIVAAIASIGAFKDGGMVSGPGTGRTDSVLARLSAGEYVVNASATKRNRPLLDAMNSGMSVSSRSSGGGSVPVINIYQLAPGVEVEQERDGQDIKITIRKTVSEMLPGMMSSEAASPNSQFSKTMKNNYRLPRSL